MLLLQTIDYQKHISQKLKKVTKMQPKFGQNMFTISENYMKKNIFLKYTCLAIKYTGLVQFNEAVGKIFDFQENLHKYLCFFKFSQQDEIALLPKFEYHDKQLQTNCTDTDCMAQTYFVRCDFIPVIIYFPTHLSTTIFTRSSAPPPPQKRHFPRKGGLKIKIHQNASRALKIGGPKRTNMVPLKNRQQRRMNQTTTRNRNNTHETQLANDYQLLERHKYPPPPPQIKLKNIIKHKSTDRNLS
eukprot:TRINITY_DN3923_c0_g3_i1.p2 TRINITY_DN3923_c0_g3~~TRINITY_DN3923_c0_g3_i1.p2  ORF type:complete len:243 (+),score=6.19 TRINITY_DN3923_c0_g3_i1:459-1187(+)